MFKKTLTKASHLIGGTVLAQLIAVLSLPLLSRLYEPTEFAVYAVVAATSALVSIAVTLRFEVLLLKATADYRATQLLGVIKSLMLAALVILFAVSVLAWLLIEKWFLEVVMSSLGAIFIAAFNLGQNLSIRDGEVRKLKYAFISRAALFTILSVVFSLISTSGLVYAFIFSYLICDLIFFRQAIWGVKWASIKRVRIALIRERKNVLFYTPHSFYGTLILHAPTYVLTAFYSASTVGLFNMANRLVSIPMSVLTGTLNKISFNEFSKDHSNSNKKRFFISVSLAFAAIYSIFSLVFWLYGEVLVKVVLGENWSGVYWYVLALMPWIAFRTVAGVFAFATILRERQGSAFLFELLYGCLSILVLTLYSVSDAAPETAILAFSITGALIVAAQLSWYYALLFKKR